MIITKEALPRRTFLRGLGASLSLPLLDAMVPAATAARGDRRGAGGRTLRRGLSPGPRHRARPPPSGGPSHRGRRSG